jgi:Mce-associated membrane protein
MAEHADATTELSDATNPDINGAVVTEDEPETPAVSGPPRQRERRTALVVGMAVVTAVAAVAGWLGYRAYEAHEVQQEHELFLQTARQAALHLTSIDHTRAEEDVQRILDLATGAFHDDFQRRSGSFIEVVKTAQSRSEGSITEAGLESVHGGEAQVLVAVTVNTSNVGAEEQEPRAWRMRITVQKTEGGAKVSNVEFVP